jgi:hypothetical protein
MPTPSSKRPRRPRDINELAFQIVQEATEGRAPTTAQEKETAKNPAAVALGRLGGRKGGLARAEKLSDEQRKSIAQTAARARWDKKEK